ncbi:hypothetical protein OC846_003610 [Tilletia horrida]|uniref:Uncharacterized protein n=1 Tax=Tilletia horrida TaxID=155126 RepID=A0AAN6GPS5_9BASI|nr:hypothetical protein OC846_003610 [Tilletia horrida]KAK0550880.1 hypothetical protein OC845_002443 [Tilletia horrida]KAK0565748.1 hypothetical protein OC861_003618 [Tilletia horrida]
MSNNAGESVGNAIKGAFNAIGGAGESIRGNINAALDGAGEAITHNTSTGTTAPSSMSSEDPNSVAKKGEQQFKEGIAQLKQT